MGIDVVECELLNYSNFVRSQLLGGGLAMQGRTCLLQHIQRRVLQLSPRHVSVTVSACG